MQINIRFFKFRHPKVGIVFFWIFVLKKHLRAFILQIQGNFPPRPF